MNETLAFIESWGLYSVIFVLTVYFCTSLIIFVRRRPEVAVSRDPILLTTTFAWGSLWLFGNGIGNALFIFAVVSLVRDIAVYHTGSFAVTVVPGAEALLFLIALMPSLYQFRYQADPGYMATLPMSRRIIAIGITAADGVLCALGWYWWLLPPTVQNGQVGLLWNQPLLLLCFGWGIATSYIAQFMAHMQVFEIVGMAPPRFQNPFAGIYSFLPLHREGSEAAVHPARKRRAARPGGSSPAPRVRTPARTHPVNAAAEDGPAIPVLQFDEMDY